MTRRTPATLAYDALALEGGLFNAEWLAKVAHLEAPLQKPDDYAIPAGLALRDEIARAWRMAQAQWLKFQPTLATPGPAAAERFVTALLETVGFDALEKRAEPIVLGERSFPISHAQHHIPILIAAPGEGLDEGHPRFGEGGRRRSPFGLLQEYLNADHAALWGIVSNGRTLRLARDNASLTRPAWLEADLERIFTEERFADFSVLWLILHASRFGQPGRDPADCPLEAWRQAGQQAGIRAREALRRGVERALRELGQGFLAEPANAALRGALTTGALTPAGYFQELLRLVYRLIFLLTVEERGLLHPPGSDPAAQALYARGYGLRRLRERAVRHSAHDAHTDLYAALKVSFRGLARGEPRLALPALGGLFGDEQTPQLDAAALQNRHLLGALWALAWIARDGATERVNWRDMGPEELGSVYESLLELVPVVDEGAASFSFAGSDESRGNARKLSGSYYTPDSLVQALLDSALEPVIAQKKAERPEDEAGAILSITVIDPAVGSGHFLLAAARRLAAHLARARAEGQPGAAEHRRALREVVSHCLFGVDRNPMALELAKIALWLEAMTPEAPLSFLDTHLVLGDALLGVLDPACLAEGIPDEAFKPLTGDDKATCERLKKRNREARKALGRLTEQGPQPLLDFARHTVAAELAALDDLPDDTLEQIAAKRAAYEAVRAQQERAGLAEDLLLAAYLSPKRPDTEARVPTGEHLLRALTGQPVDEAVVEAARQTARAHHVLHWREAFAQVFARGGFDCVLGNPPWEMMQLAPSEFFASSAPSIANAQNHAAAQKLIAGLANSNPHLLRAYEEALHETHAKQAFVHGSGRYPLTSLGRINLAPLFAETALCLLKPGARSGLVLPSGIATDSFTQQFFRHLADGRLVSLVDFENRAGLFPAVDSRQKFSLLTLGQAERAELAFFLTAPEQLKDARRRFSLTPAEFALLNPNTRTCPVFRSQADAELTKKIYRRVPVLWDETRSDGNPWGLSFMLMFMMNTSSYLFRTAARRSELADPVPLYEAKMIHQFDHRWATYAGAQAKLTDDEADGARDSTAAEKARPDYTVTPRYWVERAEVEARLQDKGWQRGWLMGWRDICRSTDERTVIAAVFPRVGVGHTLPIWFAAEKLDASGPTYRSATVQAALIANLNTLILDFIARQKVGGTHLTYSYFKQFPVLPPTAYTPEALAFIVPRVLELTYTAFDLKPFYDDLVAENPAFDPRPQPARGQPFPWDPARRAELRAELDACYARLYGLTRDELRYLLDPSAVLGPDYPSETFRVLKEKEIRQYGEYRTQRLVLAAWDRLETGDLR
ncbi:MAG TPA: N-6 DNA methylase [Candidatus Acidoferrales bacterium]|nr:N-6 DNA methylase [Candidatus Acidoferrales bacterium]